MRDNVQLPLKMEDFVDYHADHLLKTAAQVGVTRDLAKSVATVNLAAAFPSATGESLQIRELKKSLATTGVIPQSGTTGADALKTEDLVDQIQSTELTADDYAPAFKWITKKPCKQDVLQLTALTDYGSSDDLGFLDETAADGGLDATDPTFERKTTPVKWLGGHGQVMRTALVVEALGMGGDPEIGNAMDISSFSRLERLYRQANYHLWHADNSKNEHEMNGIIRQITMSATASKPVELNLNGDPLTPDWCIDVEQFMFDNGSRPTDVWSGMGPIMDLRKELKTIQRGEAGGRYDINVDVNDLVLSQFGIDKGNAKLHRDKHLDVSPKDGTQSAAANAPVKPTSVTVTDSGTDAVNKWHSYLNPNGGTYYYAVSAVGVKGESDSRAASTSVTVDPTDKAVLTITRADADTKFYYIYRGTAANSLKLLDRVKCTGATDTYEDKGDIVPGTSSIVFLCARPTGNGFNFVQYRQLWPIDKIKLPVATMAEQFAWLMAGTPQILRGPFNFILRNVGRLGR